MSIADIGRGASDLDALAAAAQGFGGGVAPPTGLPDVVLLTRLANDFFAAVPGQSLPTSPGPSVGGIGASPVEVGGTAAPHAGSAVTTSLPTGAPPIGAGVPSQPRPFDASALDDRAFDALVSASSPSRPSGGFAGPSAPGIGVTPTTGATSPVPDFPGTPDIPSVAGAPALVPASRDVSVLDLSAVNGLIGTHETALPHSVEAGPSLSGYGTSRDAGGRAPQQNGASSVPGANQNAIPQPPPSNPPAPVLVDNAGLGALGSTSSHTSYGPIPANPFESELRSILAPLAAEPVSAAPAADSGSALYFLTGIISPSSGIAVPGQQTDPLDPGLGSSHAAFDVHAIRRDFPILNETVNGRPLIWFDNAATTQKPKSVIERISYFYEHENSNIHRAAHEFAARATDAYEGARNKVTRFLNAGSSEEIIFTRGTTEAINLVAATFGNQHIGPGDEIVITNLEHHANIVPWQQLALAKGAKLRVAPVDDDGALLLDEFGKLLNAKTKLVAFTQVSNALGTITPAKAIVEMAHRVGARVLVDGAQSVSHMKVDVQDLDADFFVFSGHKLFGPTGIGVLYGKKDLMDSLPPYQTGGNMIKDVTFERVLFHASPQRFEAGTGNIADAVGLGAAIDYVERIGLDAIAKYEHSLLVYATRRLKEIPNLRIIGNAPEKASVISLVIKGVASEEVGAKLNKYGIAVRSGHHCAQPILRRFGQETTVRPSFAFYNTCAEIDVLVAALKDIQTETGLTRLQ